MSNLPENETKFHCPRHGAEIEAWKCRWCAEAHVARELAKLAKCPAPSRLPEVA